MKDGGWLVRVEVEAGRGEITPIVFAVAYDDHQEAMLAVRSAPDVARECSRPRVGGEPWPIRGVELVAPVDARTVKQLGLERGELWNVYDPPLTDRI